MTRRDADEWATDPAAPASGAQPRERQEWIDLLRGETVLLVVVFHSTSLLRHSRASAPRSALLLNDVFEPYWMPTLSFLSGTLAGASMGKAPKDFYGGKARSILYPFAIWSAVHGVVFKMRPGPRTAVKLASGGSYLFFLEFLFGFDAVAYRLRKLDPGAVGVASLAVSGIAPALLPNVPDRFTRRFAYLLSMFMLGRASREHEELWSALEANPVAISASFAAAATGTIARLRGAEVSYRWEWALAPALATLVFARSAKAGAGHRALDPVRFVGRNSIVFYTAHFPLAYGAIRAMDARGARSGSRTLMGALGVSLVVPTALALARRKSRFARRLFAA